MSSNQETSVNVNADEKNNLAEINSEMGLIGPGKMLGDAREKLGLSKEEIAKKLNFRISLVQSIEDDAFDPSLPETFTRGYLCSYAKLVNVSNQEILNSYELLSIAKIQCAEMQSFSKTTQKEAENSLVTWITYLIAAFLIGSTFFWWLQDSQSISDSSKSPVATNQTKNTNSATDTNLPNNLIVSQEDTSIKSNTSLDSNEQLPLQPDSEEKSDENFSEIPADSTTDSLTVNLTESSVKMIEENLDNNSENILADITPVQSKAVFTFTGDCWVSIYDATGERIAYGVKKTGYVMTISGVAPFKVDIGRPALTSIIFNGEAVDMSGFDKDNIAKFTLPIVAE